MGKHKEWRKKVKKERRRRIRTQKAKEKDLLSFSECEEWYKEQEILEQLEIAEIERCNEIENSKWLRAELQAMEQWQKLQLKKEMLKQKQLQQQAKLKLEWELEQQRKEKEEQRLKEIAEENAKRQELFISNLEKFLNGDSTEPPKELLVLYESKPNSSPCPFFTKTACCRFGDNCSRNHKYPGISKILLIANMFGHFGLENSSFNEYDTDIMLEYDDSDTYKDFKDFFFDVLSELQKFGNVVQLKKYLHTSYSIKFMFYLGIGNAMEIVLKKVCNNYEKHLRGNTYVEYEDLRSAVAAYRGLHARWYGGKQLSLQFCQLISWKQAICGLQSNKRCPKGRACNFLHIFKNPIRLQLDKNHISEREQSVSSRSWRWSESPERDSKRFSKRSNEEKESKDRRRHRHQSHRTRSHRHKH